MPESKRHCCRWDQLNSFVDNTTLHSDTFSRRSSSALTIKQMSIGCHHYHHLNPLAWMKPFTEKLLLSGTSLSNTKLFWSYLNWQFFQSYRLFSLIDPLLWQYRNRRICTSWMWKMNNTSFKIFVIYVSFQRTGTL